MEQIKEEYGTHHGKKENQNGTNQGKNMEHITEKKENQNGTNQGKIWNTSRKKMKIKMEQFKEKYGTHHGKNERKLRWNKSVPYNDMERITEKMIIKMEQIMEK